MQRKHIPIFFFVLFFLFLFFLPFLSFLLSQPVWARDKQLASSLERRERKGGESSWGGREEKWAGNLSWLELTAVVFFCRRRHFCRSQFHVSFSHLDKLTPSIPTCLLACVCWLWAKPVETKKRKACWEKMEKEKERDRERRQLDLMRKEGRRRKRNWKLDFSFFPRWKLRHPLWITFLPFTSRA